MIRDGPFIGGSLKYAYKGFSIVTKVRAATADHPGGGLVYQVIRLSDGWKLGVYSTFSDAQAAIDNTLAQAA
jgi:hypothetical protein